MWNNLNEAATSLQRDGWMRDTAYWWKKLVSGRFIWIELDWNDGHEFLMPVMHEDEMVNPAF